MTQTELLALFDQYHDLVYRLALSYTGSIPDAEDVVQTVFLKLLEGTPPPQPGKERPWLSRVAVNCCRDLLRRRKYRRHEPLEAAEQLFTQLEDRELYTAVMELPEKERAAVSMRLHRGRKKLQAYLKEDGYETAVSKNL